MPLFFIEMGQGIIATGDLRVRTSALYSCTLIAGHNARSGYGGAYHYPSDSLDDTDVRADMDVWAAVLRPTAVTLIHALDSTGMGLMGTVNADKLALRNWVIQQCGVIPATVSTVGAGMELVGGGGFNAGSINNLLGNFDQAHQIQVKTREAGTYLDYGRFTLVGHNREG